MRLSNLFTVTCLSVVTAHRINLANGPFVAKSVDSYPIETTTSTTVDACIPTSTQVVVNPGFEDENGGENENGGTYFPNFPGWNISSTEQAVWNRADHVLPGFVGNPYKGNYGFAANSQAPGGTVTLSQTLCVIPNVPYDLSGYIGYFGSDGYAPIFDVLLDDVIVLSQIAVCTCQCVADPFNTAAGCAGDQVPDTYCQITATATPAQSMPVLTFVFYFENSEEAAFEGDLDEVTLTLSECVKEWASESVCGGNAGGPDR